MSRVPQQKSRDVDEYVRQVEDVYDLELELDITPKAGAVPGLMKVVVRAYDRDDDKREEGPLLYAVGEASRKNRDTLSAGIRRVITEVVRQAMELYPIRQGDDVIAA